MLHRSEISNSKTTDKNLRRNTESNDHGKIFSDSFNNYFKQTQHGISKTKVLFQNNSPAWTVQFRLLWNIGDIFKMTVYIARAIIN